MLGLGAEELLLVAVLAVFLFKPADMVAAVRKMRLWRITLESWAQGMWKGWQA